MGRAIDGVAYMTGHSQLAATSRDRFLQAVQKELEAFEQREREFIKEEREERARQLRLPINEIRIRSGARNKTVKDQELV
jgi:hypothetical protein